MFDRACIVVAVAGMLSCRSSGGTAAMLPADGASPPPAGDGPAAPPPDTGGGPADGAAADLAPGEDQTTGTVKGRWYDLAGVIDADTVAMEAEFPALALDSEGNPVLAWRGVGPDSHPNEYVRRFDGSKWLELAGSGSGDGVGPYNAHSVGAVAVDPQGRPILLWPSFFAIVRRWSGQAWDSLAANTLNEIGAIPEAPPVTPQFETVVDPGMVLDRGGLPVVVWHHHEMLSSTEGHDEIRLRRLAGGAWQELAGSGTGDGLYGKGVNEAEPEVVLDEQDRPVVLFREGYPQTSSAHVVRWTGQTWEDLLVGEPLDNDSGGGTARLATGPDGRLVVALVNAARIEVRRLSGTQWMALGGPPPIPNVKSIRPDNGVALAVDEKSRVLLCWVAGYDIVLARFDGQKWEGLDGSISAGGLSQKPDVSSWPALAVRGNRICVAWKRTRGQGSEGVSGRLHVRCLDE